MKMAKGFKRIAVGLLAAIIAAASFVGCGGTSSNDNRNITMDVASAVTVEVGSEYRIPSVFAYDGANDYAAVFTVKNGDKEIALSDGKFTVQLMSDYTITYYADCGNGKSITKTTVVKVKDETAPVISFGAIVKGALGKRYVPDFAVSDNSGKAEVTMTVKYEDGNEVAVSDNGFTPDKAGNYTVCVTATDANKNSASEQITVQVGETFVTAVAQDLETQLFAYQSGASEVAIGEAGKTEGIIEGEKSFKINVATSDQWPSYSLAPELARAIVKVYDAIEVDVYTSGAAHAHKIATGNKWGSDIVFVQPATWTTLTFTKEAINGYTGKDDQWRLLDNGNECNENFTIYFDNVRGVMQPKTVILGNTIDFSDKFAEITAGFENSEIADFNVKDSEGNAVTEGVDASAYNFAPSALGDYTVSATLRKENYRDVVLSIAVSVEKGNMMTATTDLETLAVAYVSGSGSTIIEGVAGETEGIINGNKAVKANVVKIDQWPSYELNPEIVKKLVKIYDAIKVDVYTAGAAHAHKIAIGNNWEADKVVVQPGTWTTLTFTKETIEGYTGDNDQRRLIDNGNEINEDFTLYFDNLRGVIYEENAVVGEAIDFSAKLNAIKTELGADDVTLAIKTATGSVVGGGLNGLAFTPEKIGKYVAVATFVKANYNDYSVTIDFTVEKANMYPAGEHKDGECAEGVFRGDAQESVMSVNANRSFVREGNKSICYYVDGNKGYPSYYIDAESAYVKGLLANYDEIAFDVYIDGAKSHDLCAGKAKDTPRTMRVAPKTWTTVTMSKEVFAAYNGQRLVFNDGGDNEEFRLYIDNLRGVKNNTDKIVFGEKYDLTERVNAIKTSLGADDAIIEVKNSLGVAVGEGIEGLAFTPNATGNYTVIATFGKENYNDYTVSFNLIVEKTNMYPAGEHKDGECAEGVMRQAAGSALSVNTDLKFIREGNKSICYFVSGGEGYPCYYIDANSAYVKGLLANYDEIAFDVYIDGVKSHDLCVGTGKDVKRKAIAPKTWTTITLSKEVLAAYNGERMFFNDGGSNEEFRLYFDNLRGIKLYKDESAAGEAFDLTERINAIKTSLGADSATIEVKTAGGVAVTDGINGLIFTPSAEGEYIITVTFVKENYNDYTVEYSLLVHQAGYLKDAECAEGVMRQAAGSALSVNTDLKFIREGDKSICYFVSGGEGYPCYYIDANSAYVKGLLEKYNAISFDIYIDGVKSHDLCVGAGKDVKRKAIAPKTWTTITLSKEVLAAYNGERIFFNDGASNEEFRIYFDNLRGENIVKDGECFEGVMKESGGAVMSVNTDPAFITEGDKSICYTVNINEGYPTYFIDAESAYIKGLLEKYNAISFDVYIDGVKSHDLCVGTGKDVKRKAIAPKTWTTITLSKEVLAAYNGERMFFNDGGSNEGFRLYIDNICGVNV